MTTETMLTGGERKLLRQMATGAPMVADARGGYRVGSRRCGAEVVDRLKRMDLVEASGAGERLRISGPGMAHVQRLSAPDMPNRMPARAADRRETLEA
ncbi:MAG: hypothetical protein WA906_13865, partial [Pacificimonas sp.]